MKTLVTGGAGFIGSHLVRRLLELDHKVRVLDDLSTGSLDNLPVDPSLELVVGHIADKDVVESALEGQDAFVHLAAVASVQASVEDPLGTHRTNLEGSIRLFETAARLQVRRAVYASSAAVYGDNPSLPLSETAEKRPLTPYAADKLAGEHYLAFFHASDQLDATAFRFFNVFGPRQDPSSPYSGVISIFLDRARRRQPVVIFGDGTQTRDFVYVTDVVDALVAAVEEPPARRDVMPIFNVGRGTQVSLLELLDTVQNLPGVERLPVTHEQARSGDIKHSVADVSALRATGWQPRTSLGEGLEATFRYVD